MIIIRNNRDTLDNTVFSRHHQIPSVESFDELAEDSDEADPDSVSSSVQRAMVTWGREWD